ncbi:MAG TPA: hypothetical protein DDW49_08130 [Deltaproteobacteria bacterium]|nr:hypothetical protein [Deltaproteobacteria bacterium]
MKKKTGLVLAGLVASAIMAGQVWANEPAPKAAKVKCSGINACKGTGSCHSADNACKGQNACKGKGWVEVGSEKECTDKSGTVVKS